MLTIKDEARWAIGANLSDVKKLPNFSHYIDTKSLSEVDANAVEIE